MPPASGTQCYTEAARLLDAAGHRGGRAGHGHWNLISLPHAPRSGENALAQQLELIDLQIQQHHGHEQVAGDETTTLSRLAKRRVDLAARLTPAPAEPAALLLAANEALDEEEARLFSLRRRLADQPTAEVDLHNVERQLGVALFLHAGCDKLGRFTAWACPEIVSIRRNFEAMIDTCVRACVHFLHGRAAEAHVVKEAVCYASHAVFDGAALPGVGLHNAGPLRRTEIHFQQQYQMLRNQCQSAELATTKAMRSAANLLAGVADYFADETISDLKCSLGYTHIAPLARSMPAFFQKLEALPGAPRLPDFNSSQTVRHVTEQRFQIHSLLELQVAELRAAVELRSAGPVRHPQLCISDLQSPAVFGALRSVGSEQEAFCAQPLTQLPLPETPSYDYRYLLEGLRCSRTATCFLEKPNDTAYGVVLSLFDIVLKPRRVPAALLERAVGSALAAVDSSRKRLAPLPGASPLSGLHASLAALHNQPSTASSRASESVASSFASLASVPSTASSCASAGFRFDSFRRSTACAPAAPPSAPSTAASSCLDSRPPSEAGSERAAARRDDFLDAHRLVAGCLHAALHRAKKPDVPFESQLHPLECWPAAELSDGCYTIQLSEAIKQYSLRPKIACHRLSEAVFAIMRVADADVQMSKVRCARNKRLAGFAYWLNAAPVGFLKGLEDKLFEPTLVVQSLEDPILAASLELFNHPQRFKSLLPRGVH